MMTDEVLEDIRQQIAELNRKTPRIRPWYVRLCAVLFILFLAGAATESLTSALAKNKKCRPVDSWTMVESLVDRGELAAADAMMLRLEKKAPAIAIYHKGDILREMGRVDEALVEYKKLYEACPNDACAERVRTLTKVVDQMKKTPNQAMQADGAAAPRPGR